MRWVKVARALIRPFIVTTEGLLELNRKVEDWLMRARYVMIVADMELLGRATLRKLKALIREQEEGTVCGYVEELGLESIDIIEALERDGCSKIKIIKYGDGINRDTILGCPKIRREVGVSSSFKVREWVCVGWKEESEEKLIPSDGPVVEYVGGAETGDYGDDEDFEMDMDFGFDDYGDIGIDEDDIRFEM